MDVGLVVLTALSLATAIGLGALLWSMTRREHERTHARVAALSAAMAARPSGGEGGAGQDWRGTVTPPRIAVGSAHRLIRLGVAATMVLAIAVAAMIEARRATGQAFAADGSRPLELVSMRHVADGATLTVSGIVRTPVSGGRLGTVTAVVTVFDRDGATVATGSVPVALAPGNESSFTVAVPGGTTIARYRVTFRAGQTIVRHVDRRNIVASLDGR